MTGFWVVSATVPVPIHQDPRTVRMNLFLCCPETSSSVRKRSHWCPEYQPPHARKIPGQTGETWVYLHSHLVLCRLHPLSGRPHTTCLCGVLLLQYGGVFVPSILLSQVLCCGPQIQVPLILPAWVLSRRPQIQCVSLLGQHEHRTPTMHSIAGSVQCVGTKLLQLQRFVYNTCTNCADAGSFGEA